MTLDKNIIIDLIEVTSSGCVQVRTKIIIMEDGNQISSTLHRHVIAPGDDYSGEDASVQGICNATHTADVISTYKAAIAAQGF